MEITTGELNTTTGNRDTISIPTSENRFAQFKREVVIILAMYLAIDTLCVLINATDFLYVFHFIAIIIGVAWTNIRRKRLLKLGQEEIKWYEKYFNILLFFGSILYFFVINHVFAYFKMESFYFAMYEGFIFEGKDLSILFLITHTITKKKKVELIDNKASTLGKIGQVFSSVFIRIFFAIFIFVPFIFAFLINLLISAPTTEKQTIENLEEIKIPEQVTTKLAICRIGWIDGNTCKFKMSTTSSTGVLNLLFQPERIENPVIFKGIDGVQVPRAEVEAKLLKNDYSENEEIISLRSNTFPQCLSNWVYVTKKGDEFEVKFSAFDC